MTSVSEIDVAAGLLASISVVIATAAYLTNRRSTSAKTFLEFRAQYDGDEFRVALGNIGRLTRKEIDLCLQDLHRHRRALSSYFQRLCQLRRAGYIRRRDFLLVARSQGSLLMLDPIAAIEWELNRQIRNASGNSKARASFDHSLREFLKFIKMLDSATDYRRLRGRFRRLWHCRSFLLMFDSRCLARPQGSVSLPPSR